MRTLCHKNNIKEKSVDDVIAELKRYHWPGNVRELQNVLERMLIMSGEHITLDNIPDEILVAEEGLAQPAGNSTLRSFRNNAEREFIVAALKRYNGNVTRAATELGVSRTYLHRRLGVFGITKSKMF